MAMTRPGTARKGVNLRRRHAVAGINGQHRHAHRPAGFVRPLLVKQGANSAPDRPSNGLPSSTRCVISQLWRSNPHAHADLDAVLPRQCPCPRSGNSPPVERARLLRLTSGQACHGSGVSPRPALCLCQESAFLERVSDRPDLCLARLPSPARSVHDSHRWANTGHRCGTRPRRASHHLLAPPLPWGSASTSCAASMNVAFGAHIGRRLLRPFPTAAARTAATIASRHMRARQEEPALVAGLRIHANPRLARDRLCRHQVFFFSAARTCGYRQMSARSGRLPPTSPDRRRPCREQVSADMDRRPTAEFAPVSTSCRRRSPSDSMLPLSRSRAAATSPLKRRCLLQQRLRCSPAEAFRQIHRGLRNRQHSAWRVLDHVADPVVPPSVAPTEPLA